MKTIKWTLLFLCCLGLTRLAAQPTFQVRKEGAGKRAIVFIPGFACSGDVWEETVKEYKNDYTCYILTMPGFAGVKPDVDPDLKKWVAQIAGFIKEHQLEKPIIVGHSLGGGMALLLASRYPDLVGRIVVVDVLPCLSAVMNPGFRSDPNPDCSMLVGRFTKLDDGAFVQMQQQSMRGLLADTTKTAEVIHWGVTSNRQTLGRIFCQFSNMDLRDSLGTITCPAMILLEAPFVRMKPAVEAQYQGLHTATLSYATKGLHFIMFDDRQWYMDHLAQFIKQ
ncbi:MAG TPA: alpha/beta hydrolase [Puia sp.]|nr:alpha/beta hydrolase [Puia sp.]